VVNHWLRLGLNSNWRLVLLVLVLLVLVLLVLRLHF
jgi:hypothetical protein